MTSNRGYRIELAGRVSDRMLAPYIEEFEVVVGRSTTTLSGVVRDAAHLHGVITHLTGLGLDIVSVGPAGDEAGSHDDRIGTLASWRHR